MDFLFDPNNEEERLRRRMEEYYGEFSDNARNKLFAKNIEKPTTVYDLLYPKQRESLLSKNATNVKDGLDEAGQKIRDYLLAKNIIERQGLLESGEDVRKSLEARNNISKDNEGLLEKSGRIRKGLIAKNGLDENDLLSDSKDVRRSLVSKNRQVDGTESELLDKSQGIRESNIAKNVESEGDLLSDSKLTRDSNIAKITSKETSLEKDSDDFRKFNVHKNKKHISLDPELDLAKDSQEYRDSLVAKNVSEDKIPLDVLFESARNVLLSKGVSESVSLLDVSDAFRNALMSKNVSDDKSIEELFASVRQGLLSANASDGSDLLGDSERTRKSNIKKNVINETSLEEFSKSIREGIVSNNVSVNREDLIGLFDSVRNGLISANKSESVDLLSLFNNERQRLLSANGSKEGDLQSESNLFRSDAISKNTPKETDLETGSVAFRDGLLANNSPNETDLETGSVAFRDGLLANNNPRVTNLETDSVTFRDDLLSNNNPRVTNLETDSVTFRDDLLAANIPNLSDIETDSVVFRDDLLAANIPRVTNLETDSVVFRDDLLAANVPNPSDIATDSVGFRDGLLAANVPNPSDIATDSVTFRDDLLAANVPNPSDIATDSEPFRDDLLAANVPNPSDIATDSATYRNDLLASNVPSDSDLLTDSQGALGANLSNNIFNSSNLLIDSAPTRDGLTSANVPKETDVVSDSENLRRELLSRNTGGLLGININAAGTSTFLGVSRVLTQGILFRALLLREGNNKYRLNRREYMGDPSKDLDSDYAKHNDKSDVFPNPIASTRFGVNTTNVAAIRAGNFSDTRLSMSQSLDKNSGALGVFGIGNGKNGLGEFYGENKSISDPSSQQKFNSTTLGKVTEAIRKLNISKNSYALNGGINAVNDVSGYDTLNNLSITPQTDSNKNLLPDLFQDLIQKSVGKLDNPGGAVRSTPTTNKNEISSNNGKYFKRDAEEVLNELGHLGVDLDIDQNPEMLASKLVAGNPFDDKDFREGKRGVKRVVNLIKNTEIPFAKNFDPQNEKSYVTGLKSDGSKKSRKQRYTVKNPYAPKDAETLIFYIENYSMPLNERRMYFPPYITSFQNGSSANWNEVNFLGRPEPLYTYNNSKRTGSISFYVLTDYAQEVDIGLNQEFQNAKNTPFKFDKDFSTSIVSKKQVEEAIGANSSLIKQYNKKISDAEAEGFIQGIVAKIEFQPKIDKARSRNADLNKKLKDAEKAGLLREEANIYSESSFKNTNIYNSIINGIPTPGVLTKEPDGSQDSKPEDTVIRLNDMKRNLQFQPAYFSGSKKDFVNRMEFLEKTVRPSRNGGPGLSFLNPPICHIHLGTWYNNDVVIDSVDFDYTDAPWTSAGKEGTVQPMWAQVTISFSMIGEYKQHGGGIALTSTDKGGFYQKRK